MNQQETTRWSDWPVELTPQEDGSILVTFPDVPDAITEAHNYCEAMEQARDCLIAALGGYIEMREAIPQPSPAQGQTTVGLPAITAAKIALYGEMITQGVNDADLAARLDLSEVAVRRMIDLDCRSPISQFKAALHALRQ